MRKYYYLLLLAYILPNIVYGQSENFTKVYNFQAPSVAAFNTYGAIPVSLYTGTPDISIPIYTLKEHGVEVPIGLRYNINNVKPNSHPGFTGLGWTLFAGGSITRTQNGRFFDEYKDYIYAKGFGYLNNEKRLADDWYNYVDFYNFTLPDTQREWFSENRLLFEAGLLKRSSESTPSSFKDISPDKFSFNFLNYSGSFYRDHTGKWVVDSETPFIVEHKVTTYSKTREQISKKIPSGDDAQSTIESFTLIAPDGLKFTFGGINAIDYSLSYYQQGYTNQSPYPVATTWHLNKITFPPTNGTLNEEFIKFEYQLSTPIIEGNWSFSIFQKSNSIGNVINGKGLNIQLILPVLLRKISSSEFGEFASFSYKETKELEFPYTFFPNLHQYTQGSVTLGLFNYVNEENAGEWFRYADYYDLKWQQLDEIQLFYPSCRVSLIYTESKDERLKLKSLKKVAGNLIEKYDFTYNPTKLPPYFSGHYDHMGFYNGNDFSFTLNDILYTSPENGTFYEVADRFHAARSADGSRNAMYVSAEMLTRITYPTGGHSVFEYEPHEAQYRVSLDRQSLTYGLTKPGGVRIKKISNYTANNVFAYANTYYYFLDFNPDDKELGNLSGIAAFTPKYLWELYDEGGKYLTQNLASGGTNQISSNMEGPYIGYSAVTECREDINGNIEGYTTYNYTNFGPGYFDKPPLARLYSDQQPSPFTPFSSNATKRGKLLSKKTYDRNNRLKEEVINRYEKYDNAKVRFIDLHKLKMNRYLGGLVQGGSNEVDIYDYRVASDTIKQYESSGMIMLSTSYQYDSKKQLKKKTIQNSLGKDYIVEYYYPYDYPDDGGYRDLVSRNIISTPVVKITSNNNVEIAREKRNYIYNTLGSIRRARPSSIQTSNSGAIGLKDVFIYNEFNSSDKPLEVTGKDGIKIAYIWGYNEQLVVAEIVNASISTVREQMLRLNISTEDIEKGDMAQINLLRENLSSALVTTYTHRPLVGVSSMTDPRGVTTYYDYDSFGRLKETYIIENGVKKVIQANDYHYQNQ